MLRVRDSRARTESMAAAAAVPRLDGVLFGGVGVSFPSAAPGVTPAAPAPVGALLLRKARLPRNAATHADSTWRTICSEW